MIKGMFESITKWQREVFTQATALTAANHLREEVEELIENLPIGHEQTAKMEYADCFLLLFGSASLYGLSYEDILEAIYEKMEINKLRKWGKVNEQGYVKHVPNSEQNAEVSDTTDDDSSTGAGKQKN